MPIDWKSLASARGLVLDSGDLEKIIPALTSLEAVFSPLTAKIAHETEPAVILSLSAVTAEHNAS